MEKSESGYEAELLEVFRRCDRTGKGYLDSDGLTQLCQMLHLEDDTETLISRLGEARAVSFTSFKQALLSLLSSTNRQPDRTNSPDREVSPKYVYGQKKYGRRSRPESTENENGDNVPTASICDGDNDAFQTEKESTKNNSGQMESCSTNVENRYESVEITNGVLTPEAGTPEKDIERGCSELRMVWDRMGSDGYLNKTQLAMVCSSVGMDTLADQVVEQVFSKLGREEDGRVGFNEFLELVRGWSPPSSPPPTLPLSSPYHSPSHQKLLNKSNDSEMWDSAGLNSSRLLQELQTARTLLEALTEERDKLRSDLADANQRASLLAQEVDEHHARIERATHNKVKQLELKYGEEIKQIEKQAILEKEALASANQKLEETITKHLEQINKLNSEVTNLKHEFKDLEKENKALREKLNDSESNKIDLEKQIKYFESLHQRIIELETADESIEKLKERISTLQNENIDLKDRNDELTTQLESATSRACHRREGSWGCGEWCSSVGGGGTKRRGKSPDWAETRLRHRLGKVRRCSTEYDLYSAAAHDSHPPNHHHESPLKKSDNSESGLETDIETVTGSSPTLSNTSFDNAGDCQEIEIEKLKMYINQLEDQLNKYQLKEWGEVKSPISDDESHNFPSIITVKSEPNQNLSSQTISNASDIMSYKSVSVNGINLDCRESVSTGVQTEPWTYVQQVNQPSADERLAMDVKESSEMGVSLAANTDQMEIQPVEVPSSIASVNFNDGVEWDSSETITPSQLTPSHNRVPSVNFQPFQPVSKFNFLLPSSSFKSDSGEQPETKLPTHNGFTSLDITGSSKCLSCKSNLDVDKQSLQQLKAENRTLSERCKEFENSLELMRVEYEKTEDYWASKLDEERRLYEEDQMQSDEKFSELQMKIQEYAELFASETTKKHVLPTIEEKDNLEKQFTDLEEEYDNFRQNAEDEMNEKDEEIIKLRQAIAELKSQIMDKREAESQTEDLSYNSSSESSDASDADNQDGVKDEECFKCSSKLSRDLRRKRKLKSRLVVECQALELHKRQLLDQIAALKTSSQVHLSNTQVWTALTSKLRYQESICQTLENSFRLQQKRTEQALHKAYERHKFDLLNVQNTLRMTREKLQNQSAITRQLVCLLKFCIKSHILINLQVQINSNLLKELNSHFNKKKKIPLLNRKYNRKQQAIRQTRNQLSNTLTNNQ